MTRHSSMHDKTTLFGWQSIIPILTTQNFNESLIIRNRFQNFIGSFIGEFIERSAHFLTDECGDKLRNGFRSEKRANRSNGSKDPLYVCVNCFCFFRKIGCKFIFEVFSSFHKIVFLIAYDNLIVDFTHIRPFQLIIRNIIEQLFYD